MHINTKFILIDTLAFLSILFIGADLFGIRVLNVTAKLVQVFILFLFMSLLSRNSYKLAIFSPSFFFAMSSLVSALFSRYTYRSLLYYSNVFFNVFINATAFALYIKIRGVYTFIKLYKFTMYIQLTLMIVEMLLKYMGYDLFSFYTYLDGYRQHGNLGSFVRLQLWFYEPSYLATYLIFWFMFSFSMWKIYDDISYKNDTILALIAEIITTSLTGYLSVALCFLILYIVLFFYKKISLSILFFMLFLVIIFGIFTQTALYDAVIGRLSRQGIEGASGMRIKLLSESVTVFKDNMLLGVGPGCYGRYLNLGDGYVPTNVTMDLLATIGILGMLTFYFLHVKLLLRIFTKSRNVPVALNSIMISLALGLIAFVITLQANQTYLRLYHWMFLGVLYGFLLL